MAKKEKKKLSVVVTYVPEDDDVVVEELVAPGFDRKKGPKVKKEKNKDVVITSADATITLPVTMWNHGAGFSTATFEFTEQE